MIISYEAYDKSGDAVLGVLDALSIEDAREQLHRQGLFVGEITANGGRTSNAINGGDTPAYQPPIQQRRMMGPGQRLRCLAGFTRQLHVLVASGTPLVQALQAVERQSENAEWRRVVTGVRKHVEEGGSLSEALAERPDCFDSVCRNLVAAGESSGAMTQMLERISALTRKQLHLRNTIVGAMMYPCALIVIGVGVLILMLLFVLPRFAALFVTLDVPLPASTRFLLAISSFGTSYWWALLTGLVSSVVVGRTWWKSDTARNCVDTLLLRMPKVGRLSRMLATAKIARTLGTLLESKVALLTALELTKATMANRHYIQLLSQTEDCVSRGEPMSAIFSTSDLVSPAVQEAVRNGESSGNIGTPLVQMADFLDEENQIVLKSIAGMIEPAILIALGVVVGVIAMSMFLPLFDLTALAGGA